jgi:LmbE family N-acetylglucosaminyl deacetylase
MATLFLVHAHPDDETISTGGVMLRAKRDGNRIVLITCTAGEEGEIHNMDEAAIRPRLAEVRAAELRRACEILGVDRQEFLGYRDSGMAGSSANRDPASFYASALYGEAARLAGLLAEERPDVVVTYSAEGTYGHPDHVRAHHVTLAALDRLRESGWSPSKLYLHVIPRSFLERMARELAEGGRDGWAGASRLAGTPDEEITTRVDVRDLVETKRAAFAAHVSQNDPNSPFATMQGQILESALGFESFVLARGRLGATAPEPGLFAGLR